MQAETATLHRISSAENLDIAEEVPTLHTHISEAWKKISPWWPLKNLIATNPLRGFEQLPFEQATALGSRYFQQDNMPEEMQKVNLETIKWCQVFFDEGQASIPMPNRNDGVYQSWRQLIVFDKQLHRNKVDIVNFLKNLPNNPEDAIAICLDRLKINDREVTEFLTLLLTALPGWASYIKYQNEWTQGYIHHPYGVSQTEYVAIRLILTSILWPSAKALLDEGIKQAPLEQPIHNDKLEKNELGYRNKLLALLESTSSSKQPDLSETPDAQLVFCIDVRSEPMRRAIEAEGNYETFGFAGFFGIPALIRNDATGECYASCPVLIPPKHTIREHSLYQNNYIKQAKKLYQTLKYTFTTPFVLAEALGPWSGVSMTAKTLFPAFVKKLQSKNKKNRNATCNSTSIDDPDVSISIADQSTYAESALRMIGMTERFAKIVVFCGHGSTTENNAYATALNCGACGGHDGAANAKLLAKILNNQHVRDNLEASGITIPSDTQFVAALHDTTTDTIEIVDRNPHETDDHLQKLTTALENAQRRNTQSRIRHLSASISHDSVQKLSERSADWAETRPEWGLARNAAFIIGPRTETSSINLDGRAFLHSYDWKNDKDGRSLTTILTAPMVVAQWINCQYLFSTLDNVTYGSGSKITHNVVGKIGIMQGNASDLMNGLPLQSVNINDNESYHEPMRLLTVVYSPKSMLNQIISTEDILQQLFGNGWVLLICIDPTDGLSYELQRNLTWKAINTASQKTRRIH